MMASMTGEEKKQLEQDIERATEDVIGEQCGCGVAVMTDGEVRRENYIHYFCRFVRGIDFSDKTEIAARNGAFTADVPTIVGKVSWAGPPDLLANEWRAAQSVCSAGGGLIETPPKPNTNQIKPCTNHITV